MEPNPYKPPATATPGRKPFRWPTSVGPVEVAICAEWVVLLLAALVHRFQLNTADVEVYTRSPLILVELFGVLAAFGTIPIILIRCVYLMTKHRCGAALVDLLLCPLAVGCIVAAIAIDSPTLLYAT